MPAYTNLFLISRRAGELLVEDHGSQLRLPRFPATTYELKYQSVRRFVANVRDEIGLDVVSLGKFSSFPTDPPSAFDYYYGFECLGGESSLQRYRWASEAELEASALVSTSHWGAIASWFEWWREADESPLAAPWLRPGWYRGAASWIGDRLAESGVLVTGELEQLIVWDRSTVICVPTDAGDVYFKGCPRASAHEPAITAALATWLPAQLPRLIAIDAELGWMLTRDYGKTLGASLHDFHIAEAAKIDMYSEAIGQYARLQLAVADRTSEMLELGCEDRNLGRLASEYRSLVEFASTVEQKYRILIDADGFEMLLALEPTVGSLCERLDALAIPATVEHGDFHSNQVAVGSPYVITDWSDASVSHPFLTVPPAFGFDLRPFCEQDLALERATEAYLQPWTHFSSSTQLRDGFRAAAPLAFIHRAMLYRRLSSLVRNSDDWTLNVVGYLSEALRRMNTQ